MRLFTCTDHPGFNPVPVASVIVAEDYECAVRLLWAALRERGLVKDGKLHGYHLAEIALGAPQAVILSDGQY